MSSLCCIPRNSSFDKSDCGPMQFPYMASMIIPWNNCKYSR